MSTERARHRPAVLRRRQPPRSTRRRRRQRRTGRRRVELADRTDERRRASSSPEITSASTPRVERTMREELVAVAGVAGGADVATIAPACTPCGAAPRVSRRGAGPGCARALGASTPVASTPCPSRTTRGSRCRSRIHGVPSPLTSATSRRMEFVPQSIGAASRHGTVARGAGRPPQHQLAKGASSARCGRLRPSPRDGARPPIHRCSLQRPEDDRPAPLDQPPSGTHRVPYRPRRARLRPGARRSGRAAKVAGRRAAAAVEARGPPWSPRPRPASTPGWPRPTRRCCAPTTATATGSTTSSSIRPGTG